MPLTRRQLLQRTTASLAALGLPRLGLASVAAADLRFVFVFAHGGWDVSRILAGPFALDAVDVESDASIVTAGPLRFVDHADRPSVATFFQTYADELVIIDGIEIDSVSHTTATRLALTGASSGAGADWATRLAADAADRFPLPHVVARGPAITGSLAPLVTRVSAGAGLADILSGQVLSTWQGAGSGPTAVARSRVDDWVHSAAQGRARALAELPAGTVYADLAEAQERGAWLAGLADQVSWPTDDGLTGQVDLALDLLELSAARCVTIGADTLDWDSHAENDSEQSAHFEDLFAALLRLRSGLASRSLASRSLADQTVIVVSSEMGRTPQLNDALGKDHWPTTSALLLGPGLSGGQVVGAYDAGVRGLRVDPKSLALDPSGTRIEPRVLGATLLALGGVSSSSELSEDLQDVAALTGILGLPAAGATLPDR